MEVTASKIISSPYELHLATYLEYKIFDKG